MQPNDAMELWLSKHTGVTLPAFARTVHDVAHVAQSEASSARDLSDVIANDAAMSARILQIANSSLFNPLGRKLDTVSTAVVMLGFQAVRELAVSVSVLDELSREPTHARLGALMATACHAATQAKTLATAIDAPSGEQVFVAALLREIGSMAFWSQDGPELQELEGCLVRGDSAKTAEARVLGFELEALSQTLAKNWGLGELSCQLHNPSYLKDPSVGCITTGHDIARTLEQNDTTGFDRVIREAAERFDLSEDWLRAIAEENMDAARRIALRFGIDIDQPVVEPPPPKPTLTAAPQDFLTQVSAGLERDAGRDELMRLLVDGTAAVLDARLCAFLLLSANRMQLSARFLHSENSDLTTGQTIALDQSDLFKQALEGRRVESFKAPQNAPWHHGGNTLIYGVRIGKKPVGVFYLERTAPFGEDCRSLFRQSAQQVALILTQAS